MSAQNLPVTSRMIPVLFPVLNSSFEDYYKSMFIKAKVIELMAMQFEQYEQLPLQDTALIWKKVDIDKMHQVRHLLSENLDKPWSLKELAHLIGTNEFSLKKCFKEMFGKPVFRYLHDLRMETSMQLLLHSRQRITDIAHRAGYKNPTHFTAAFKKHFGVLPNKIRVGILRLFHVCEYFPQVALELAEGGAIAEII